MFITYFIKLGAIKIITINFTVELIMDCEKIVIVLYALEQLAIIGFGKSRSVR